MVARPRRDTHERQPVRGGCFSHDRQRPVATSHPQRIRAAGHGRTGQRGQALARGQDGRLDPSFACPLGDPGPGRRATTGPRVDEQHRPSRRIGRPPARRRHLPLRRAHGRRAEDRRTAPPSAAARRGPLRIPSRSGQRRRSSARSAGMRPPQTPCWPISQCRSDSSRHWARTGQAMQVPIAVAASRRATSGVGLTGNQSSGSRTLLVHRASLRTCSHSDRPAGDAERPTSCRMDACFFMVRWPGDPD